MQVEWSTPTKDGRPRLSLVSERFNLKPPLPEEEFQLKKETDHLVGYSIGVQAHGTTVSVACTVEEKPGEPTLRENKELMHAYVKAVEYISHILDQAPTLETGLKLATNYDSDKVGCFL